MSFIHEIHKQKPAVRYAMFGLAVFAVLAAIGFFWLSSVQRDLYAAMNPDKADQQAFEDQQSAALPNPLASIGRGLGSMVASIGSLMGFDSSRGFDRSGSTSHNQDAVYPLPTSK